MALITLIALIALFFCGASRADDSCKTGPIDLVFVMDQSGSIGPQNYQVGLQATQRMTQSLTIGQSLQDSHVGFVLFDDTATVLFGLDDYFTNQQVYAAIGQASYSGGGTNIANGMQAATNQVFQPAGRQNIPQIMILLTDGQDSSNVTAQRIAASALQIVIYALGVGSSVNTAELTQATGDSSRVFSVSDWDALEGVLGQICGQIASSMAPPVTQAPTTQMPVTTQAPSPPHLPRSCGCNTEDDYVRVWLDVVFLIDSSDAVESSDFNNIVQLLDQFGKYYTIGRGNPDTPDVYTRIAVINNGAQAVRFANFSTYRSGRQLSNDVKHNLKPLGGIFNPEKGIRAAQDMFDEEEQARRRLNVRKVLVVFSSSTIDCGTHSKIQEGSKFSAKVENRELCRLISQMKNEKDAIISVAIKLPAEASYPYIDIAGKCDRLQSGLNMVENLMKRLCLANCYCLRDFTQFEVDETCDRYSECLFVHDEALSYSGAQGACADENITLSDSLSKQKDDFIRELHLSAGFFPYWIGGLSVQGTVQWDSGVQGNGNDYTNWGPNQPDGQNQCISMKQTTGLHTAWFSEKCGRMFPANYFSCQKDACSVNLYCQDKIN